MWKHFSLFEQDLQVNAFKFCLKFKEVPEFFKEEFCVKLGYFGLELVVQDLV